MTLLADIRAALRALRKTPGFSLSAVIALGIALAATTAMLSVFDRLVLHPATVRDPDSLVSILSKNPKRNITRGGNSVPRYEEVISQAQSFSSTAVDAFDAATLTGVGNPVQLSVLRVNASFFPTLGVAPFRGHAFTAEDDVPNGPAVCMLSYEFWKAQFGGAETTVGSTITLDGRGWQVIGITPPRLTPPFGQIQLFVPRVADISALTPQQVKAGAVFFQSFGRLKPGVSVEAATSELETLSAAYAERDPSRVDAAAVNYASRFADSLAAGIAPSVDALVGAVACLLLIACANTSSLFLNRLLGRRKEIAIRLAMGASRIRVVRLFVIESMVFTGAATILAVAGGAFSLTYLSGLTSAQLPAPVTFVLNVRVFAWIAVVAAAAALATGLVPAIQASRPDVVEHLKDGARGSSSGSGGRLRQILVVAEVALSTVLLAGAALLLLTFLRLQRAPLGFETSGIASAVLGLPASRYPTPQQQSDFYDRLLEQLHADGTVTSAAVALGVPLAGGTRFPYAVAGRPIPPMADRAVATGNMVSPEYFRVFGLRLAAGRVFTNDDRANAPFVCVINQTLAKRLFGANNPLGESILLGRNADTPFRIVGVIADALSAGANNPVPDELYLPVKQRTTPSMFLVARTRGDAAALQSTMQRALGAVDPGQALSFFATMEATAAASLGTQNLVAKLTLVFAALALGLAIVGLYSVLAYTVSQRKPEIGVRIALGASGRDVVGLVMGYGLRLVGIGIVIGVAAAVPTARVIRQLLFGVDALNPLVYAGVAVAFGGVAAAACLLPSLRAARTDPLISLRSA